MKSASKSRNYMWSLPVSPGITCGVCQVRPSPLPTSPVLCNYVPFFSRDDDDDQVVPVVPNPPDGGWGWVVCAAGFFCNMFLDGTAYMFGVLLSPLCEEFDSKSGTVAWVGSLLAGMYMLSGMNTFT